MLDSNINKTKFEYIQVPLSPSSNVNSTIEVEPIAPNPKKIDIGLYLGLQFRVTTAIAIDLNYYYSFRDVNQFDEVNIRNLSRKNEEFSLGVFYYFLPSE